MRDCLHVIDLAEGHRIAYDRLGAATGFRCYNLGTGVGTSVLQLVHVVRDVTGREVPYEIVRRRPGDVAELVADPTAAAAVLGVEAHPQHDRHGPRRLDLPDPESRRLRRLINRRAHHSGSSIELDHARGTDRSHPERAGAPRRLTRAEPRGL